jgi:hypothetical protein
MAAVLEIRADAAEVRRAFGVMVDDARKANRQLAQSARDTTRAQERELNQQRRDAARAANEKIRAEREVQRARERMEREITRRAQAEQRARARVGIAEAREVEKTARAMLSHRAASEREYSRIVAAETRQREREAARLAAAETRLQARRGRERAATVGRVVSGAVGFVGAVGGAAHGMIQDVRQRRAMRESLMNDALIQTIPQGATHDEVAARRDQINQFIRGRRLDPDAVIAAVGEAQSFANALGGNDAATRNRNLQGTLADVDFAAQIDPRNMGGLVKMGALMRGRVPEAVRRRILRSAVGISFQGSVETDEALRSGLSGMLQSIASATATAPESQRAAITEAITRDFLAQIQTVAATGGAAGVTAGRVNTLRTALSNVPRQNRLGEALVRRA